MSFGESEEKYGRREKKAHMRLMPNRPEAFAIQLQDIALQTG